MNRDDIIRMAKEAGFEIGENEHQESIFNSHTNDEHRLNAELERFAVLVAAAEWEAISDEYSSRLQGDLENGVRWLNEAASKEFQEKYPELAGFSQWLDDRERGGNG